MEFKSGISGAIKKKLGEEASQEVDRERHELRDKFNDLILEEDSNGGNNNSAKVSFQVRFGDVTSEI
jgi:hypothetical protein